MHETTETWTIHREGYYRPGRSNTWMAQHNRLYTGPQTGHQMGINNTRQNYYPGDINGKITPVSIDTVSQTYVRMRSTQKCDIHTTLQHAKHSHYMDSSAREQVNRSHLMWISVYREQTKQSIQQPNIISKLSVKFPGKTEPKIDNNLPNDWC